MDNFFTELGNLKVEQLLGLSVLGAIIAAAGNLLAVIIRDYFIARSFATWKDQRDLRRIYARYRDPIVLSSLELAFRIREIVRGERATFLSEEVLETEATRSEDSTTEDPYFKKYKFLSTIYRLCAWLGWLELYRRDVTFLDSGRSRVNRDLERCIRNAQGDLADGRLNTDENFTQWEDALIFREEQRALGEMMIRTAEKSETLVRGYGDFHEVFFDKSPASSRQWLHVATNFFIDLKIDQSFKDFRYVRCLRLAVHLVDLIESLDSRRVAAELPELRYKARKEIEELPTPRP